MRNEAKCNQAIDKAMQLFWEKGYAGTSMRDLQVALDMRPGSIYASLGDKDAIFLSALQRYREYNKKQLLATFEQAENVQTGLLAGINLLVFPQGDIPSQHCFMVKTLSELETQSPKLVEAAQAGLADVRGVLAEQIAQLIDALPGDNHPQKLAGMVQAQVIGLKTMMSLGRSVAEAKRELDFMLATILPQLFEGRSMATH